MKLSRAWERYKDDKEYLNYSPHTLEMYSIYQRLFIESVGDREIDSIKYPEIRDYIRSLTHLKDSSLVTRIRHLRSFFRWAHEEGFTEKNEAARLREPKLQKATPKPLSLYE